MTQIANIRGNLVEYDACHSKPGKMDDNVFAFIGRGTIHSINGVEQLGKQEYYFYKYREDYQFLRNQGNLK